MRYKQRAMLMSASAVMKAKNKDRRVVLMQERGARQGRNSGIESLPELAFNCLRQVADPACVDLEGNPGIGLRIERRWVVLGLVNQDGEQWMTLLQFVERLAPLSGRRGPADLHGRRKMKR